MSTVFLAFVLSCACNVNEPVMIGTSIGSVGRSNTAPLDIDEPPYKSISKMDPSLWTFRAISNSLISSFSYIFGNVACSFWWEAAKRPSRTEVETIDCVGSCIYAKLDSVWCWWWLIFCYYANRSPYGLPWKFPNYSSSSWCVATFIRSSCPSLNDRPWNPLFELVALLAFDGSLSVMANSLIVSNCSE